MSVERATTVAAGDLTDEQRETLALLNGRMSEILSAFDELLAGYGIQREVFRFSTQRALRSGSGSGCAMACCSCPPPEEACIEDCPRCDKPTDVIAAAELTEDQRTTLGLLNDNMDELLRGFDEALARHGIDRRVHRFSTSSVGDRDLATRCIMQCCICGPPDEACTGDCPRCGPDGGTGDGGTRPIVVAES